MINKKLALYESFFFLVRKFASGIHFYFWNDGNRSIVEGIGTKADIQDVLRQGHWDKSSKYNCNLVKKETSQNKIFKIWI